MNDDVFHEVMTNNCFDLDFTDNEDGDISMTCGSGADEKLEQHVLVKCVSNKQSVEKKASKKRGLAAICSEHQEDRQEYKQLKV